MVGILGESEDYVAWRSGRTNTTGVTGLFSRSRVPPRRKITSRWFPPAPPNAVSRLWLVELLDVQSKKLWSAKPGAA